MNKIFKKQLTNIKDIFTLPLNIYKSKYYNKNKSINKSTNKSSNNIIKTTCIPKHKLQTNYFKYNKNNKKIKNKLNNLNKDDLKDKLKEKKKIHKDVHKETIPKRIRELVWTTNNGENFTHKCYVSWCDNNINVFNFQVGHDIPESKGGTLDIDNLKPICSNCNLSMSNKYTIKEWSKLININNNKNKKRNTYTTIQDTVIQDTAIQDTTIQDTTIQDTTIQDTTIQDTTKKNTFINKIINKLPTISLLSFVLNSYKYIKI